MKSNSMSLPLIPDLFDLILEYSSFDDRLQWNLNTTAPIHEDICITEDNVMHLQNMKSIILTEDSPMVYLVSTTCIFLTVRGYKYKLYGTRLPQLLSLIMDNTHFVIPRLPQLLQFTYICCSSTINLANMPNIQELNIRRYNKELNFSAVPKLRLLKCYEYNGHIDISTLSNLTLFHIRQSTELFTVNDAQATLTGIECCRKLIDLDLTISHEVDIADLPLTKLRYVIHRDSQTSIELPTFPELVELEIIGDIDIELSSLTKLELLTIKSNTILDYSCVTLSPVLKSLEIRPRSDVIRIGDPGPVNPEDQMPLIVSNCFLLLNVYINNPNILLSLTNTPLLENVYIDCAFNTLDLTGLLLNVLHIKNTNPSVIPEGIAIPAEFILGNVSMLKRIHLDLNNKINLNLNMPYLTDLIIYGDCNLESGLSGVPKLQKLCILGEVNELNLTHVPHLEALILPRYIHKLDLTQIPKVDVLNVSGDHELDISKLTQLSTLTIGEGYDYPINVTQSLTYLRLSGFTNTIYVGWIRQALTAFSISIGLGYIFNKIKSSIINTSRIKGYTRHTGLINPAGIKDKLLVITLDLISIATRHYMNMYIARMYKPIYLRITNDNEDMYISGPYLAAYYAYSNTSGITIR